MKPIMQQVYHVLYTLKNRFLSNQKMYMFLYMLRHAIFNIYPLFKLCVWIGWCDTDCMDDDAVEKGK